MIALLLSCASGPKDRDGDGFTSDVDCDDSDGDVFPGAADDDGPRDADCDGYATGSTPMRGSSIRAGRTGLALGFALASSEDGHTLIIGSSADGVDGQILNIDVRTEEIVRSWHGRDGDASFGQAVAVLRDASTEAAWVIGHSDSGIWSIPSDAPSGYVGAGGATLFSDGNGIQIGLPLAIGDLLGDRVADIAFECASATDGLGRCVVQGPLTPDRLAGDCETGIFTGSQTGLAVGDLDGDGAADLAAGERTSYDGPSVVRFYPGPLIPGRFDADLATNAWDDESRGDWLGEVLNTGDIDGDGTAELLASAPSWPDGERKGRLYVLKPGTSDLDQSVATVSGAEPSGYLGSDATASDVNGDGVHDLVAGQPQGWTGRVLLFLGPVQGPLGEEDADIIISGRPHDRLGWAIEALSNERSGGLAVGAPSAGPGRVWLPSAELLEP